MCNFQIETHSFKFTKHVSDDQHPSSVANTSEPQVGVIEPTGTAFLSVFDVVAVCDSPDCALVLFAKNLNDVLVVSCPKEISSIHVSSFERVGITIFLASSTSML